MLTDIHRHIYGIISITHCVAAFIGEEGTARQSTNWYRCILRVPSVCSCHNRVNSNPRVKVLSVDENGYIPLICLEEATRAHAG